MRRPLVLLLLALNGCYSYVPAATGSLSPGTPVRARLSTPSDVRLANVSVNDAVRVDGEVVAGRADTLVLSAFSVRAGTGYTVPAAGETVRLPVERISGVERRKLSVLRSAALVVLAATASVLAFSVLDVGGSSGGGAPQPRPQ